MFIFITARVRSTREGTVFTGVCLFTFRGPSSRQGGGEGGRGVLPCPRSRWGDPIAGVQVEGGYPVPGPGGGGVSHPVNGGTLSQVQGGMPQGTPIQDWMGYPPGPDLGWGTPNPELDGVSPWSRPGMGYPQSRTGWGTPPPIQDWMGTPHPIRRQSSIANTRYVAGGMPLEFTQEDFLVNTVNI